MAIPELDLKKVNLQAAVGYLISLHDNEVDWNLLGLHLVGAKEELPIPAGNYEYGDVYMIGNETDGWHMYVWSRADGEVHKEDYWFPVGQFPKPGPQGPKGDGIGQVQLFQEGLTTNLTYDTSVGCKNNSLSSMTYVDSTTGQRLTQTFQMTSRVPFTPGKYINMDATEDNKKVEIKIDESQLKRDYYKISKGDTANVPAYSPTSGVIALPYSYQNTGSSLVRRGAEGEAKFTYGIFGRWNDINSGNFLTFDQIYGQLGSNQAQLRVSSTTSNTGVLTFTQFERIANQPQTMIRYGSQLYYRMDPSDSPDGTISFIHIDSLQDGNSGYKATGKSFTINVNTRSWQVVDLDFGSNRTTHNISIFNGATGTTIYFTLTNSRSQTFDGYNSALHTTIGTAMLGVSVDANGKFYAGMLTTDGDNFKLTYGEGQEILMTQNQCSVNDTIMQ